MRKTILPLLLLLPVTAAYGFDAYFYKGNTVTPVQVAKNVVTVSFLPETTCVRADDFTTAEIGNSEFDYMLFRQKAFTTGLSGAATTGIAAEVQGGCLYVKSDSRLISVTVYTTAGTAVARAQSPESELSMDLSGLASGVYVVEVSSEKEAVTLKIINK